MKYGQDILEKAKQDKIKRERIKMLKESNRIGRKVQAVLFSNFISLYRIADLKAEVNHLGIEVPEELAKSMAETQRLLELEEEKYFDTDDVKDEIYIHQRVSNELEFQDNFLKCNDMRYMELIQVAGAYFLNRKKMYGEAKKVIINQGK